MDEYDDMLELEVVLPGQMWTRQNRLSGVERLSFAVLIDALRIISRLPKNNILRYEAEEWVARDDTGPFAFLNICDALGFEASRIRALVARNEMPRLKRRSPNGARNSVVVNSTRKRA